MIMQIYSYMTVSIGNLNRYAIIYAVQKCLQRSHSTLVYKNRNPRNLELLGLADKRKGWEFQSPRIDFWHKVYLEKNAQHTTGVVCHTSNHVVLTASTREPSICKHLYSCVDVSAAENIGRILALRCHQCGLLNLFFDTIETPLSNESTKVFHDALLNGGICLEEAPAYDPPEPVGIDYDALTDAEKRDLYPSLIENLRTIPDWDNIPYPYSLRPLAGKRKLSNKYQILSKVRQGMVWDSFYGRMVLPENKAHWQHELEAKQKERLEQKPHAQIATGDESVELVVPSKWKLDQS